MERYSIPNPEERSSERPATLWRPGSSCYRSAHTGSGEASQFFQPFGDQENGYYRN